MNTVEECLNKKQSNEVVFSLDQEYDSGYDGEADEKDEAFLNENGHWIVLEQIFRFLFSIHKNITLPISDL